MDVDTATLLLGLDGVAVADVEPDEAGDLIFALVTDCAEARCCPDCGQRSARSLGLVTTRPRDVRLAGRPTLLRWTKRRWACRNIVCDRRSFTESLPSIPPRSRLTTRLRSSAGAAVADTGQTVLQSARDRELSWSTVNAAFITHAQAVLPAATPAVEHLGIDETRRGKAKFRLVTGPDGTETWEVVADRWHVGFCDLTGGAGLLGQVEGRNAASASEWIDAQGRDWRAGVRVVAIDMCTVFKAAVRDSLPHALLVVDLFHVVQLANAAVTEVRHRVTLTQRGRRGRKGNREWELRNRLTRAASRMHGDHLDPMVDDLKALPRPVGEPILAAWNVKEDLRDLLDLHGTNPGRNRIYTLLTAFYQSAAASGLPEMERLARQLQPGGRRSWPGSPPASRTPHLRASTGRSKPTPAAPTATATPPTSDYAPTAPPRDALEDTSHPEPAAATASSGKAQTLDVILAGTMGPASTV